MSSDARLGVVSPAVEEGQAAAPRLDERRLEVRAQETAGWGTRVRIRIFTQMTPTSKF